MRIRDGGGANSDDGRCMSGAGGRAIDVAITSRNSDVDASASELHWRDEFNTTFVNVVNKLSEATVLSSAVEVPSPGLVDAMPGRPVWAACCATKFKSATLSHQYPPTESDWK